MRFDWRGGGGFFECSRAQKNPIVPVGADVEQLSHVDQGKSATVFRESAFLQLVFEVATRAICRPDISLHVRCK